MNIVLKKKRNKLIQIIAISLFIIIISSPLYAINEILLGNVDATPPTTLPVPETGSLLTTSGTYWVTEGSLYGGHKTGKTIKSVDGGLTWTTQNTSTQVTNAGIFYTGSSLIAVSENGSSMIIRRSVNGGISWDIKVTHSTPVQGSFYPIAKSGNRLWVALGKTNIYYSDDDGINWVLANTNSNFCGNGPNGIAANGNIIVIGSHVQTVPACTESIRVSTDNGASWSSVTPNCTPTAGERSYSSPIFVQDTFFISVMGNSGRGCILSSTDGVNWVEYIDMPFTTAGSNMYGSLGSFFDNATYYLYLAIQDSSDNSILKVWRTPKVGASWTLVYNTMINTLPGNLLTASNNKIYFGTDSNNFYKIE